jgi:hypothetical protein
LDADVKSPNGQEGHIILETKKKDKPPMKLLDFPLYLVKLYKV